MGHFLVGPLRSDGLPGPRCTWRQFRPRQLRKARARLPRVAGEQLPNERRARAGIREEVGHVDGPTGGAWGGS